MDQPARHLDLSDPSIRDHESAFISFLGRLEEDVSIDRQQVKHICHRVVHGGDYTEPTNISEESYHHIETLSDLAPLRVPFVSSGIALIELSSWTGTMLLRCPSYAHASKRCRTHGRLHFSTPHFTGTCLVMSRPMRSIRKLRKNVV